MLHTSGYAAPAPQADGGACADPGACLLRVSATVAGHDKKMTACVAYPENHVPYLPRPIDGYPPGGEPRRFLLQYGVPPPVSVAPAGVLLTGSLASAVHPARVRRGEGRECCRVDRWTDPDRWHRLFWRRSAYLSSVQPGAVGLEPGCPGEEAKAVRRHLIRALRRQRVLWSRVSAAVCSQTDGRQGRVYEKAERRVTLRRAAWCAACRSGSAGGQAALGLGP